jgi:hypothetical protein
MEEAKTAFPFKKLKNYNSLIREVMTYVERSDALEFINCVNKESRAFLIHNYI